jgi:competence protein ComEA
MGRQEQQSRAEIARRRLAALTASFDDQAPPPTAVERPRSHAAEVAWRVPGVRTRAVVAVAVAAGVLLSWWLLSARPRTSEPETVRLTSQSDRSEGPGSAGPADPGRLVIDVEGKVKRPGIVTLPRGARVHHAISRAGGVLKGADTSSLNLARILADGEQVIVGPAPAPGSAPGTAAGTAGTAVAAGGRISLNAATLEQLDTLPGVGPVTAQAIIDYRTSHGGFQRVEDLLDVKGIGEQTLADLKDQVGP